MDYQDDFPRAFVAPAVLAEEHGLTQAAAKRGAAAVIAFLKKRWKAARVFSYPTKEALCDVEPSGFIMVDAGLPAQDIKFDGSGHILKPSLEKEMVALALKAATSKFSATKTTAKKKAPAKAKRK